MEALQWISDGSSFSYGWSTNTNPSYDSANNDVPSFLDASDDDSFIELNSKLTPVHWETDSFEFERSQASALVHADQIISNGLLLPLHLVPPAKDKSSSCSCRKKSVTPLRSQSNRLRSRRCSVLFRPTSLDTSAGGGPEGSPASLSSGSSESMLAKSTKAKKMAVLRECVKSSKKLFVKYLSFLRPFCTKKVKGLVSISDRKVNGEGHQGSKTADPGTEKAIHDAVLHCRNSFSKSL